MAAERAKRKEGGQWKRGSNRIMPFKLRLEHIEKFVVLVSQLSES